MCLDAKLSKKQADEIIQQAKKRGYIRVFKVCEEKETGWLYSLRWRRGIRKAKNLKSYSGGWYAFLSYKAAKKYIRNLGKPIFIKTCYIKPQWIKRLGRYNYIGKAGIFTHLAFPDWDKGDMTVREFRQMCKEYKEK
jgi:hypothetical protein